MKTATKYKMSFTTSSLRRRDCITMTELFLRLGNWDVVRKDVLAQNILQLNAPSSQKRIFAELKLRLEKLSSQEMLLLTSNNSADIDIVLWLALCRTYSFLGDFAKEVIHEKFVSFQRNIEVGDYELFFERKCSLHPELLELSDSSKTKIRQVIFKMLHECGIVNRDNEILATYFSPETHSLLATDEFSFFPAHEPGVSKR